MMAYAALTEADRPRLQALAHLGQTAAAEALEVSPATVRRYSKKWSIQIASMALTPAELNAARLANQADDLEQLREQEKRAEELARRRARDLAADTKRLRQPVFAMADLSEAVEVEFGKALKAWTRKHGHFPRFPGPPVAPGQRNAYLLEDYA
jgi:predicted transcriptional regulator